MDKSLHWPGVGKYVGYIVDQWVDENYYMPAGFLFFSAESIINE